MQRFVDLVVSGSVGVQVFLGFVAAFFTALVRVILKVKRMSWPARFGEAFLCSMLSTAFCQLLVYFFDMSYDMSIAIGVLTAYLGTDFISGILVGVIKYRVLGHSYNGEDEYLRRRYSNDYEYEGDEYDVKPRGMRDEDERKGS